MSRRRRTALLARSRSQACPPSPRGPTKVALLKPPAACKQCEVTVSRRPRADAAPAHVVWVDGFWIDHTAVTNAEFARFVAATGYKTVAEQPLDPKAFSGVPADKLLPGSVVSSRPTGPAPLTDVAQW